MSTSFLPAFVIFLTRLHLLLPTIMGMGPSCFLILMLWPSTSHVIDRKKLLSYVLCARRHSNGIDSPSCSSSVDVG